MSNKIEAYLKDVEGDSLGVVREDYTHYSKNGSNITKVKHPTDNIVVAISTSKVAKKLVGKTHHYGTPGTAASSTLNTYLQGPVDDIKVYWNEKAQGVRPLPSWLERALKDHVAHFYVAK